MPKHVVYNAPRRRPLIVFLHGGAGIQGKPDAHNIMPMEGWGLNADIVSLDYPLGNVYPGSRWSVTHAVAWFRERLNPTEVIYIGTSHGGWLALHCAHHYSNVVQDERLLPPDKVVSLYAPTDFTKLDQFHDKCNRMYNYYFTGSEDLTQQAISLRKQASLPHNTLNMPVLMFHGDKDSVVSDLQMSMYQNNDIEKYTMFGERHGFNGQDIPFVKSRIRSFVYE